jgi:hypothetical protein
LLASKLVPMPSYRPLLYLIVIPLPLYIKNSI